MAAAALARPFAATAASREDKLRKSDGWHEVATAYWRMLAIGYAVLAACFTLLPLKIVVALFSIDLHQLMSPRTLGKPVAIGAVAVGIMLVLVAWKLRHNWRFRASWPVIGWLPLCLFGLAMLVLLGQPPRRLARYGLAWFAGYSNDVDAGHLVAYLGFAVVAAFAWRDRLRLPIIGVLVMGYGFALELAQELVPTRSFRIMDLVSNGLGICLGLSWVYLYDLLHDRRAGSHGRAGTSESAGGLPGALAARALNRGRRESGNR